VKEEGEVKSGDGKRRTAWDEGRNNDCSLKPMPPLRRGFCCQIFNPDELILAWLEIKNNS